MQGYESKMTCRVVRRSSGAVAGVLWVAAAGLVAWLPSDAHTNKVMLIVAMAVSATVIAGVGYFLSKGSAEAVYRMGDRAGYQRAQLERWQEEEASGDTGNVTFLPGRRTS